MESEASPKRRTAKDLTAFGNFCCIFIGSDVLGTPLLINLTAAWGKLRDNVSRACAGYQTFPRALNCVVENNVVLLSVPSPSPGSFTQHSASAPLYGRVPGSRPPPTETFGD